MPSPAGRLRAALLAASFAALGVSPAFAQGAMPWYGAATAGHLAAVNGTGGSVSGLRDAGAATGSCSLNFNCGISDLPLMPQAPGDLNGTFQPLAIYDNQVSTGNYHSWTQGYVGGVATTALGASGTATAPTWNMTVNGATVAGASQSGFTVPTPPAGDSSTLVASTAFVRNALGGLTGSPATGIYLSNYLSASNTAAANTTAWNTAMGVAQTGLIPVYLNLSGTIPVNGDLRVPSGVQVIGNGYKACLQQQTSGPGLHTTDLVANATPGSVQQHTAIRNLCYDQNNQDGVGLMAEVCWSCEFTGNHFKNIGGGNFTWNDGNASVSYPDSGILLKGNPIVNGGEGNYYNVVANNSFYPHTANTGVGLWLGSSGTVARANNNYILNNDFVNGSGAAVGFLAAIDIDNGSDNIIDFNDVSYSTTGVEIATSGVVGKQAAANVIAHLQAESIGSCAVNLGTQETGTSISFMSTTTGAFPYICGALGHGGQTGAYYSGTYTVDFNANFPIGSRTGSIGPLSSTNELAVIGKDGAQTYLEIASLGIFSEAALSRYDGTAASPAAVGNGEGLGRYALWAYDGTALAERVWFDGITTQAQTGAAHGAGFRLWRTVNGATLASDAVQSSPLGGTQFCSDAGGGTSTCPADPGNGGLAANGVVVPLTTTVAALPACGSSIAGGIAYVTDQNTATAYLGATSGGGTTKQRVLCNGTAWVQD